MPTDLATDKLSKVTLDNEGQISITRYYWSRKGASAISGVKTNERFQTSLEGQTLENMYAIGSVLGGHNAIQQADGTGVSMMTALAVANQLINNL